MIGLGVRMRIVNQTGMPISPNTQPGIKKGKVFGRKFIAPLNIGKHSQWLQRAERERFDRYIDRPHEESIEIQTMRIKNRPLQTQRSLRKPQITPFTGCDSIPLNNHSCHIPHLAPMLGIQQAFHNRKSTSGTQIPPDNNWTSTTKQTYPNPASLSFYWLQF